MSTKRDYYEILGINKQASESDIKKAFRLLAKKYHPDVSSEPNAEEKFKEINEAYEVLSDSNKKRMYDQFGHSGVNNSGGSSGGFSGFGGFEEMFGGFANDTQNGGFGGFEDIFGSFFGGRGSRGSRTSVQQGTPIEIETTINIKEMLFGTTIRFNANLIKKCSPCKGSGAASTNDVHKCNNCSGRGIVKVQKRSFLGVMESQEKCHICKGSGKVITKKCSKCKGQKFNREKEIINIAIPKSIEHNQQFVARGVGNDSINGGPRGDIYVNIALKPNAFFTREGYNLHLDLPVSYLDAILGGQIKVPTLDGMVGLKIPAGTRNKSTFTIPKHGFYYNGDRRGDLIIKVNISIPFNVSANDRDMLVDIRKKTNFTVDLSFIDDL